VGYEGKGSLASYLKNEVGLVSSIFAGIVEESSDVQKFALAVEFTPEGFKRKDEVIGACLSYLDLIREQGVPQYVLDETVQMSKVFFDYKEAEDAGKVIGFAGNMHKYDDPKEWVSGPAKIKDLKMDMVEDLLAKLKPEDAYISYTNQAFAPLADKKEKWYGTQYVELPLDRKAWQSKKLASLKLPQPNPFIPKNLELKLARTPPNPKGPEPPKLLKDTDTWRVFAKTDSTYGQPKGYTEFLITQPDDFLGSKCTPRTSAMTKLYQAFVDDALNEFAYDAAVAGLGYDCSFTQRGISLSFSGFNDRLPDYIATVSKAIAAHLPADEAKLVRFKDVIGRDLAAFAFEQPYQHAGSYSRLVTMEPAYLPTDVLSELQTITLAQLQQWTKQLFSKGYGQALIQGNIKEDEALAIQKSVEDAFGFQALPEEQRGAPKLAQLPVVAQGYGSVLQRPEPNPANPNSAAVVQFQNADRDNLKAQMAMEVLAIIMGNPFFADLRTKQQLGYIVYGGVANREGVRSLVFTAQSSVADAPYLTDRIFDFTNAFSLKDISDEEIQGYIAGLVSKKLEKDKKLTTEFGRNWGEISMGQYNWQRREKEAEAMKALKRQDIEEVLAQVVRDGGGQRRVLTTQVFSQADAKGLAKIGRLQGKQGTIIASTKDFQASSTFFQPIKGSPGSLA